MPLWLGIWVVAIVAIVVPAHADEVPPNVPADHVCRQYPLRDGTSAAGDVVRPDDPVVMKKLCDEADVLVLLDRSYSMVQYGHHKTAIAELKEIVARAGTEQVNVIGFPSPTAPKQSCVVSAPTPAADALLWPRAKPDSYTPLLQALDVGLAHIAAQPPNKVTRIVVITDAFEGCGTKTKEIDVAAELEQRLEKLPQKVRNRVLGTEYRYLGKSKNNRAKAEQLQVALDKLFAMTSCRFVIDEPPKPPTGDPPIEPQPPVDDDAPPDKPIAPIFRHPRAEFIDVVAVGDGKEWTCSGVLLGDALGRRARSSYVLTARHCLPATHVVFGAAKADAGRARRIAETITHPNKAVDIALLRLDERVERYTHAYRIAKDTNPPGGHLRVAGYGADDATGQHGAGDLHVFDVLAGSGWGCDPKRPTEGCLPGFEMVVRGNGTHDACRGDSGGPVFEQVRCHWRLVGITSRAVPSSRRACGDGGIYTRVDAIADWLQQQMEK